MLLFVTVAHPQIVANAGRGGLGRLIQPRHTARIEATAEAGLDWAADNDCFQALNVVRYRRMLDRITGLPGCRFVVVPDAVADHSRTLELWHAWRNEVAATGQPVAFALQNGATLGSVPWHEADAVFVGGDTAWKLGPEASALTFEAHERGLWVHVGRVNSRRRWNRVRAMYADSCDGTKFSRYRDTYLPEALGWHHEPAQLGVPGT